MSGIAKDILERSQRASTRDMITEAVAAADRIAEQDGFSRIRQVMAISKNSQVVPDERFESYADHLSAIGASDEYIKAETERLLAKDPLMARRLGIKQNPEDL